VKAAVVGGGIAGLAAAWELMAHGAEVTVLEPGALGGRIQTTSFAGHPVDTGADAFLCRVPDAVQLAEELGMASELVAPAAGQALLWIDGRLRPLPAGLVLGAPSRLWPLLSSRILSPGGIVRAGLDLVQPATDWPADMAVATVIRRRFGRQVAERLVDPLIGGIHAGRTEELSVTATAPQLAAAARSHRSLLLGLRHMPAPPSGPVFLAPRAGMGALVGRLVEALTAGGVTFVRETITTVGEPSPGRVVVEPAGSFDAAVVATPARVTAALISTSAPDAADRLRAIHDASVVLVTFAYPRASVVVPSGTSGWLVPRREGRLMTACSLGSAKWPHWSDPDTIVLRVSAGRAGDRRAMDMTDETVVDRLQAELALALGTEVTPSDWRVTRWADSFPQYEVGHQARVAEIEQSLERSLPSVALAGASFRGSGIPACVASGRRAAIALCRARMTGQ
jgi:protoporphyrinogen/coproporphyrinogen III oxidase